MNARERMATAMARGEPDRVPVMCQLSLGHYFLHSGLDPVEIWYDSDVFAQALVTLQQRYRFDGILVNLPGRDPDWQSFVDRIDSEDDGQRVRWRDGSHTMIPADDNPHVYGADGEPHFPAFEDLDPDQLYYVEPHDIGGLRYPTAWGFGEDPARIGGPGFFPPWQSRALEAVREQAGAELSVHAEIFSPFSQLMELLDYQNGLMALVLDPGKVEAILDRLTEGAITLGRLYAESDPDALLVSSAFVGAGFLSRDHYERFELPFLRRVVVGMREERPDLPIYVHTCGAIGDRLDLMEASGVDGIDTLDPPPIGTVDLAEAVRRLEKRVFIKGNLDPVHTVLRGTTDDVRAAVQERLAIAAPGGAYVLSTACSVPPHAPPENIEQLAMVVDEVSTDA